MQIWRVDSRAWKLEQIVQGSLTTMSVIAIDDKRCLKTQLKNIYWLISERKRNIRHVRIRAECKTVETYHSDEERILDSCSVIEIFRYMPEIHDNIANIQKRKTYTFILPNCYSEAFSSHVLLQISTTIIFIVLAYTDKNPNFESMWNVSETGMGITFFIKQNFAWKNGTQRRIYEEKCQYTKKRLNKNNYE